VTTYLGAAFGRPNKILVTFGNRPLQALIMPLLTVVEHDYTNHAPLNSGET
jgi:hypothetical protein